MMLLFAVTPVYQSVFSRLKSPQAIINLSNLYFGFKFVAVFSFAFFMYFQSESGGR